MKALDLTYSYDREWQTGTILLGDAAIADVRRRSNSFDLCRLFSAAPQLLEVVQLMQGANWKLDDEVGMEIRRRALAAVQKALDPIARDPSPAPREAGISPLSLFKAKEE